MSKSRAKMIAADRILQTLLGRGTPRALSGKGVLFLVLGSQLQLMVSRSAFLDPIWDGQSVRHRHMHDDVVPQR